MYVGTGASRVRNFFALARKRAPCILFLDELDALGGGRDSHGGGGGGSEHTQTVNQLLCELDGISESASNWCFLGATNRYEALDDALVRPGRLDRVFFISYPDAEQRLACLKIH